MSQQQPSKSQSSTKYRARIIVAIIVLIGTIISSAASILAVYIAHSSGPPTANSATATIVQDFYLQTIRKTPSLMYPLNGQDAKQWEKGPDCQFLGGQYQAIRSTDTQFHLTSCIATMQAFQDFVYQVEMTIKSGDCGGIVFRANYPKYYYFYICQDSSYGLFRYEGNAISLGVQLQMGLSTISIRESVTYSIGVVARNDSFSLYVGDQLITSTTDDAYPSGQIGVLAKWVAEPTSVAFSNAKVWRL